MELDKNIEVITLFKSEGQKRFREIIDSLISFEYKSTDSNHITSMYATSDSKKTYILEYMNITIDEINDMLSYSNFINLSGRYIPEFNAQELNIQDMLDSVILKTNYSLWDGNINFKEMILKNSSYIVYHSIFFNSNLNFDIAKLKKSTLSFVNSIFFSSTLNFNSASFKKTKINFFISLLKHSNIKFRNLKLDNAHIRFYGTSMENGHIDFSDSKIEKSTVNFSNSIMDTVLFIKNNFKDDIDLRFSSINNLYLFSCSIKQVMHIEEVKQRLSFYKCINLGNIDMDWDRNSLEKIISKTYRDPIIKNNFIKHCNATYDDIVNNVLKKNTDKNIAQDFLLLKENYRNIGQYDWEDEAYQCYMKYNTKSMKWFSKNFGKKLFNSIFGAISGYGTKVENILLSCLVSILVSGAIYCNAFYDKAPTFRSILKSMYFSTITFLTIGYGDLSPIREGFNDFQTFWTGFEGFTGLLLMSMVTVVIMRKILR